MYSIEQVKQIIGEGDKNPLYKTILTTYPKLNPLPTIKSLHNNGNILDRGREPIHT